MFGVGLVLLYFLLALVAAALIMQPDQYAVSRSAGINADVARVFALARDPAHWAPLGAASVVESSLDERIVLRLGPTTLATVFLRPEGAGTVVECVVTGRNSLVDKARAFLGHREKTLGPKMEKALAGLAASA
ncbi:hypothetical protein [Methylocystis echinoides]|uniref:Uncharacterized protein n=1 Tax=Methylocystis echinoides TaxID=29468 RepID=A0A9W6LQM6_9HYPH|nr:hypothetical protein [Methylocystis echinoides]GLI91536.1 hypothetical protein LMG27198_05280 [Methylocystis echinoides]